MTTYTPDLPAYFERIGYSGDGALNRQTLDAIAMAHVCSVPFDNVDVLLHGRVDLDPVAVERKLVRERRGGYCFEQNSLLLHVLDALGFQVTPLSARVRIGRARHTVPPRTHLFVLVDLDSGPVLMDVGVGAMSITQSLTLSLGNPQPTPHETRRIVSDGVWHNDWSRASDARLFHQVLLGGQWQDVCDFSLEPMPAIDREMGNWYTSAHPDSSFRNRLIAARATEHGRVTLLNRTLKTRDTDGVSTSYELDGPEQIAEALLEHFGVQLPAGAELHRLDVAAKTWG